MKVKYFTPADVALHSSPTDIYVSIFKEVFDLTEFVSQNKGDCHLRPILDNGGKDISHWFDEQTKSVRYYIDELSNLNQPYVPMGRFFHVPPPYPTTDWANDFGTPWWKNEKYKIGKLSDLALKIKIVNTLSGIEDIIEIAIEDTIMDIMVRYLPYNKHAASYVWKYEGQELDMNKCLKLNGIKIDHDELEDVLINPDDYPLHLLLYYKDDLTEC